MARTREPDAAFADPLELDQNSHIGTPGMVEALRAGSVTFVNALGAGIVETRAMLAFLPNICRQLLGEEQRLPSIATWWCGQKEEREHVAANIERMIIGPAYSTRPFFDDNEQSVLGSTLRDIIDDFRPGSEGDKIDLSGVASFDFIGSADFSAGGSAAMMIAA